MMSQKNIIEPLVVAKALTVYFLAAISNKKNNLIAPIINIIQFY